MSDHPCAVDDCERPRRARGWCDMHYRRYKLHGDPSTVLTASRKAPDAPATPSRTPPPPKPGQTPCQADPDLWHSDQPDEQQVAARACQGCPVREQCLAEALLHEAGKTTSGRYGIWGGLTPKQRARMDPSAGRSLITCPECGSRARAHQHTPEACLRRQEVALLTARGHSREAIAHRLGVTVNQVVLDRAALKAGAETTERLTGALVQSG